MGGELLHPVLKFLNGRISPGGYEAIAEFFSANPDRIRAKVEISLFATTVWSGTTLLWHEEY